MCLCRSAPKWLCKQGRNLVLWMLRLVGQPHNVCLRLNQASPQAPSETLSRSWWLDGGGIFSVFQISHAWVSKPAGGGEGK